MSALKISLAQINPTIADIQGNIALMQAAALKAYQAGAALVVFPELSLTAYYPGDFLEEPEFLARVEAGLAQLLAATRETPGLHWVVGAPCRRHSPGRPLENSLLVLENGRIVLTYAKQLLPNYNVFNERRHFEPGPDVARVLRVGDVQIGFLICEDGWNDTVQDYAINPFARLSDASPDVVISINASPANKGKRTQRHQLFTAASTRYQFPIVFVNQVGGHDQLVFDGASFIVEPERGLVFEAPAFETSQNTVQFAHGHFSADNGQPLPPLPAPLSDMACYERQIILGLQDYARRCGFRKVLVGSSGGIDSALTLALATQALGAENVVAVTLPSRFSSTGSVTDSQTLCQNLGIPLFEHPIAALVSTYSEGFEAAFAQPLKGLALENLQARIRGTVLMAYSNTNGHLLLTTGNKSEISVGYCTLYGDTNGGLGLIGDLYKTEVFELSRYINTQAGRELIPQAIIDKEPSAELAPNQRDIDSLPPYPVLDTILKKCIEGNQLLGEERVSVNEAYAALAQTAEGSALIEKVKGMIARNEYKRRQAPPILRLRPRAFGTGRQMPIAAYYKNE